MLNNEIYLIKDLSSITGLSVYTIKYYLKLGLIREIGRSPGTNFRYFDNSVVETLKKIISYRKNKISLSRIADIVKQEEMS